MLTIDSICKTTSTEHDLYVMTAAFVRSRGYNREETRFDRAQTVLSAYAGRAIGHPEREAIAAASLRVSFAGVSRPILDVLDQAISDTKASA